MELIRLKEQNPYWENAEKIKGDPHLEMLASSPREIINPVEKSIDLKNDGVFIIRGPRQVGKTTFTIISKKLEPVDWQTISQTTSIGSHSTVQSYIEDLTYLFVLEVLYPLKFLGSRQISFIKRRKIYFIDPFIFHTLP